MIINTEDLKTWTDCDRAIASIRIRKMALTSSAEYEFKDAYCVGGSDHPYVLPEVDALEHLWKELEAGGYDAAGKTWEVLRKEFGTEQEGTWRFDVTRQGCQPSSLFVEPLPAH